MRAGSGAGTRPGRGGREQRLGGSSRLRRLAWLAYDHLGGLVLLNLVWTLAALPWLLAALWLVRRAMVYGPLVLVLTLAVVAGMMALAPPTLLLFLAATVWQQEQRVDRRNLLRQWRALAGRVLLLSLIYAGGMALLGFNALFYRHFGGLAGLALSFVCIWLLVFALLMAPYPLPVLCRWRQGLWPTLRLSLILVLRQPSSALLLGFAGLLLLTLGLVSGVGWAVGLVSVWALLASDVVDRVSGSIMGRPAPPEPQRSWRELLRPWEQD